MMHIAVNTSSKLNYLFVRCIKRVSSLNPFYWSNGLKVPAKNFAIFLFHQFQSTKAVKVATCHFVYLIWDWELLRYHCQLPSIKPTHTHAHTHSHTHIWGVALSPDGNIARQKLIGMRKLWKAVCVCGGGGERGNNCTLASFWRHHLSWRALKLTWLHKHTKHPQSKSMQAHVWGNQLTESTS